jgi:hypothetical protein
MSMNHIRLYNLFRKELHLADDKAADFVQAVEDFTGLAVNSRIESMATKTDILSLVQATKNDIRSLEESLRNDIRSLDQSLRKNIHSLEYSLRKDIQESKEHTYKAIYLTGIVQFIAMIGSLLAIIKFLK